MDKRRIIATPKESRRTRVISIRITPEITDWLKKNNYSPTKIFYEALRDLECPYMRKSRKSE
jgi:hypothetical protein